MKHAAPGARELGVRHLHILGADQSGLGSESADGVFHPDLVGIQVRVLQQLGTIMCGRVRKDGMDEVSLGAARGRRLKHGQIGIRDPSEDSAVDGVNRG